MPFTWKALECKDVNKKHIYEYFSMFLMYILGILIQEHILFGELYVQVLLYYVQKWILDFIVHNIQFIA